MGVMSKYNKGGVTFEIDIKNFRFVTLEELFARDGGNTIFGIDGLYINKKSSFGDHPVAIVGSEEMLVDLPAHLTEDVKEMLQDKEVIDAIKDCKVGFTVEQYEQKKYKKLCYGIRWEDLE